MEFGLPKRKKEDKEYREKLRSIQSLVKEIIISSGLMLFLNIVFIILAGLSTYFIMPIGEMWLFLGIMNAAVIFFFLAGLVTTLIWGLYTFFRLLPGIEGPWSYIVYATAVNGFLTGVVGVVYSVGYWMNIGVELPFWIMIGTSIVGFVGFVSLMYYLKAFKRAYNKVAPGLPFISQYEMD